ncbi:hypothetical protein J4E82_000354 [Alternaria postmessia]|uniref:uncharacterized protein n=1 Tax=Alternaria postmessia TaxID=1187938 RepID=UPI0022246226|nr:uncharacterized protein J4E82_000354 [Alternaria postmessia]KAI5381154.1 hypothetical protein J4E82_000354 [Alternaria postmessia]
MCAGPAGLMAAWWMARCGTKARIIDKRGTKVINGHADGLRPRTNEFFDSMGGGIIEKLAKESFIFENLKNWFRDSNGQLIRAGTQQLQGDYVNDLPSPFLATTISQGRIERFILDSIAEVSNGGFKVERGVVAESLVYDASQENNPHNYPIQLTLRTLSDIEANPPPAPGAFGGRDVIAKGNLPDDEVHQESGTSGSPGHVELVKAKYVIGCDGAHSWLRQQLNYKLEGASAHSVWGAIDIVPMTNFPDIHHPSFIKTELGILMIIPRERNMTRLYVPLDTASSNERLDRSSVTLDQIFQKAKKFFQPYTLDFKVCEWWSVYGVGQLVAERNQHPSARISLAGDAVHMHSPKIGLGMNTSMQDGYNLGWKVAMAAAGIVRDEKALLTTYVGERYPIAQRLVAYDRTLFGEHGIVDPGEYLKQHERFKEFADGFKLDYPESMLVAKTLSNQAAATGLIIGESFKHQRVLGHVNSQLYWTTKLFQSDGRFRIVLLAGDVSLPNQMARVNTFCKELDEEKKDRNGNATSLLRTRYPYCFVQPSPPLLRNALATSQHPAISFLHERPCKSMIDLLAIHSTVGSTDSISMFDFPVALYGPFDADYHGWDHTRIHVDQAVHYDRYCDGLAYERWGVDRTKGAVVVIRPDMHVGWVGDLEDTQAIELYFSTIFK